MDRIPDNYFVVRIPDNYFVGRIPDNYFVDRILDYYSVGNKQSNICKIISSIGILNRVP